MFGRPKKVKELGKPMSAEESIAVKKSLRKMYPHLTDENGNWTKPKKKSESASVVAKAKENRAGTKSALESALSPEELKRLRGK